MNSAIIEIILQLKFGKIFFLISLFHPYEFSQVRNEIHKLEMKYIEMKYYVFTEIWTDFVSFLLISNYSKQIVIFFTWITQLLKS